MLIFIGSGITSVGGLVRRVVYVVGFTIVCSISVGAGPLDDLKLCQAQDADQQIYGCTRLLNFPKLSVRERANVLTFRGIGRLKKKEFDQAIADFTLAIRTDPKLEHPHNNRGNAWFEKEEYDLAFADFNEAIRLNSRFAHAYNGRGNIWQERGDFSRALADYDQSIRFDPKNALPHNGRANVFWKQRQYDKALAEYNEALKLSPDLWMAYLGRGNVWKDEGQYSKAINSFNEAIRLNPTAAQAFSGRGATLTETGEYQRGLRDLNEAIKLNPRSAVFYANRANTLREMGDRTRAMSDIDEALRLDPKNATVLNNRALFWRDLGEYDRALADFDASIRLDPEHRHAYANRGEIWRLKGNLENALADQNRQIELDPKNRLGYLLRADTLRYMGRYEQALADYDAVIRTEPDYIPAFAGKGLTFEKMGDFAQARTEFKRAISSPSQIRYDLSRSALETAKAHLAALDASEAVPVIPAAPAKVVNQTSIPTQSITASILNASPPADRMQAPERQGRRVALIIGNSRYEKVPELANPRNDATAVATALRNLGFETISVSDAPREKLIGSLKTFAEVSDQSDWAMIYYAGHGIEVNGQNYMIPTDAALRTDRDVQFEAVALDQVMATIDGARKIKLVVLDACRDNPFAPVMEKTGVRNVATNVSTAGGVVATRSVGRGLGEVKVSGASLVVFAAKHGQTALDGEGGNSPFAVALVQRIATPGIEINKVFRLVRDDVMEATAGRQEPYTYGSLPGKEDFYFLATK